MLRYYHYQLHQQITSKEFHEALQESVHVRFLYQQLSDDFGYLIAEGDAIFHLEQLLPSLIQDFDYGISIMVSFGDNDFTRYVFEYASTLQFKQLFYLQDVVMHALKNEDKQCQDYARQLFDVLTKEEIELLEMYFQCSFNALKTSEVLYLHRNTFHYRLNKIFDKTGIDFKDYNNSCLLGIVRCFLG